MRPADDDVAALLLARADDDIALVRACLALGEVTDAIIGFHAQQAAEKLLTAVLARCRATYPFTHDLARLMELVEAAVGETPPDEESVAALTPWAVAFRYDDVPDEAIDRATTLNLLERLRGWATDASHRGSGTA